MHDHECSLRSDDEESHGTVITWQEVHDSDVACNSSHGGATWHKSHTVAKLRAINYFVSETCDARGNANAWPENHDKENNRGGRGTKAQPIEHCVSAVEMHEAAGTHAPQNGHNRASFGKGPCAFDAEVVCVPFSSSTSLW